MKRNLLINRSRFSLSKFATLIVLLLMLHYSTNLKAQFPDVDQSKKTYQSLKKKYAKLYNEGLTIDSELYSKSKADQVVIAIDSAKTSIKQKINTASIAMIDTAKTLESLMACIIILQSEAKGKEEKKSLRNSERQTQVLINSKSLTSINKIQSHKKNILVQQLITKQKSIVGKYVLETDDERSALFEDTLRNLEIDIYSLVLQRDGAKLFPASRALFCKGKTKRIEARSFIDRKNFGRSYYATVTGDERLQFLGQAALQTQGKTTSMFTEIISDHAGAVKFSLSTLVSTTKDTVSNSEERQKLMGGGGNVMFTAEYPLFYWSTNSTLSFILIKPRISGDIKAFSASPSNPSANANLGVEIYHHFNTEKKQFNFFLNFRAAQIIGFTKEYYQNLGVPEKPFGYGQLTCGVSIFSKFKISFVIPIFASYGNLIHTPITYGGQLLPSFIE